MIAEQSFPWGWQARAACRDHDPGLFFAEHADRADHYDTARTICRQCPVRHDCLDDALRTDPGRPDLRHGIRGGLTPDERHAISRTFGWWKETA